MSILAGMATAGVAMDLASRVLSGVQGMGKSSSVESPSESFGMHMIKQLDKNGNGSLNVQEIGGLAEIFARLDSDNDGVLVAGELDAGLARAQAARRAHANAGRLIEQFDLDRNGLLSETEWDAGAELFASLDQDGDGQVGAREIVRGYSEHRQAFEQHEGI